MTVKSGIEDYEHPELGPKDCENCGEDAVIWYNLSLRPIREWYESGEKGDTPRGFGYFGYCEKCAKHMAYGFIRDIAALHVGEEIAQAMHLAGKYTIDAVEIKCTNN